MKKNNNYFILLLILLICISIGYAVLNSTLTINGKSNISKNTWDLYFDNIRIKDGSVEAVEMPVIENATAVKFKINLNKPGDYFEFTFDVVNNGSIDAMIDSIIKELELTAEQEKYLNYTINYDNGEEIKKNDLLYKNTSKRLKVLIEYKKEINASDLPINAEILNLGFTLNYIQSDGRSEVEEEEDEFAGMEIPIWYPENVKVSVSRDKMTLALVEDGSENVNNFDFFLISAIYSFYIEEGIVSIDVDRIFGYLTVEQMNINSNIRNIFSKVNVTEVVFGNKVTKVIDNMFYNSNSLMFLRFSDSENLKIGNNAFSNCKWLKRVENLPVGLTKIGDYAFANSSIENISYDGTIEQWNSIVKGENWNQNIIATKVTCSNGTVNIN